MFLTDLLVSCRLVMTGFSIQLEYDWHDNIATNTTLIETRMNQRRRSDPVTMGICPMKKPKKMMKHMTRIKPVILRFSTITGPSKVCALEACKLV